MLLAVLAQSKRRYPPQHEDTAKISATVSAFYVQAKKEKLELLGLSVHKKTNVEFSATAGPRAPM